jgi:uncharacterized protein (TIGR00255 family)
MYISMTGFGSAALAREWGTLTLDLSSVNHRYQEIYVRLPRELTPYEPWFHQKLRGYFRRGKVQARVDIIWAASSLAVSLNRDMMAGYYREISEAGNSLGMKRGVSLDALVGLPGVLDTQGRLELSRGEGIEAILSELISSAAEGWNEMRRVEGSHLESAVAGHVAGLESHISEIERIWPDAKDAAFRSMVERINRALEASNAGAADDARFAQEAVIFADRWDISEEIARLGSHIAKFRETGASGESEGRKLDFIVQEMNREVNTINSKVSNSEIRWVAVEAKSAIERIREQIQNLE